MAVIIDEPFPIPRATASQLIGQITSLGVIAPKMAGVISQSYLSAIYGNSIARAGERITLRENNIMDALEYLGRFAPCIYPAVIDSARGPLAPTAAVGTFRWGVQLVVQPDGVAPASFNFPITGGFANPWFFPTNNPFGNYGLNGFGFEVFGATIFNLTKANLIAGQLPKINFTLDMYMAYVNPPPPTAFIQFAFCPAWQNNGIILPAPYFNAVNLPRGKTTTTRGFTLNNLAALTTPYNLLPSPYAGIGIDVGNLPTAKASLMAFYRQGAEVGNGGFSYVYNPADGPYPAAARIFSFNGNFQVFPPLYYVYGTDPASTITWHPNFPSYSANPLDSRP